MKRILFIIGIVAEIVIYGTTLVALIAGDGGIAEYGNLFFIVTYALISLRLYRYRKRILSKSQEGYISSTKDENIQEIGRTEENGGSTDKKTEDGSPVP